MNLSCPERRADLVVLLGLSVIVAVACFRAYDPYTFIFRDGSFYATTNRAIAESFSLRQEGFQPRSWYDGSLPWYRELDAAWSNISVGSSGAWYPKHSYLMPVFSTPLYVLWGPPGLLVFNGLALVLGLFSGYRLGAARYGPVAAGVAVLVIAHTPVIAASIYVYSHDVFSAALGAAGLLLLDMRRPAAGGALVGLALFAKLTNVTVVGPIALALVGRDRRDWLRAGVGAAVPLLVYALANQLMYGAPWRTGYHAILTVSGGKPRVVSLSESFNVPLADGFRRYFTGPGELWDFASVPLLAFAGVLLLALRAPLLAAGIVLSLALFLCTFAKYHYGGARFFTPHVMLAALPGAAVLDGAAALVGRAGRAWSGLPERSQRIAGRSAAGVALGVVLIAWVLVASGPRGTPSLSRDVERLAVQLDNVPCDYFNMTEWKWECSGLDANEHFFVGRALGEECSFAGRPMLRVPPNPKGKLRELRWQAKEAGSGLLAFWGLDHTRDPAPVKWSVRVEGGPATEYQTERPGLLRKARIATPVPAGATVVVTVPPMDGEPRGLCLDVALAP